MSYIEPNLTTLYINQSCFLVIYIKPMSDSLPPKPACSATILRIKFHVVTISFACLTIIL